MLALDCLYPAAGTKIRIRCAPLLRRTVLLQGESVEDILTTSFAVHLKACCVCTCVCVFVCVRVRAFIRVCIWCENVV
jgi:hypothetical protein